ncbi:hypothetical protein KC723_00620 [Candidatus Kaiserbacteria bacterium]|nr:hypothetical protein [Candidatus Kaiserbacteria bacterium]
MSEVLHANIFFIIASIATVVFSILICFILYQIFKILQGVRSIVDRVEKGSEVIAEDIEQIRDYFASGGFVSRIIGMFMGVKPKTKTKTKTRRTRKDI